MSLIEITDSSQLKRIQAKIKQDCVEFNAMSIGTKARVADQLYTENRILKELGVAAVDTIEKMDVEIELKDNKINALEVSLKEVNQYDEQKIQHLLNKNPVIRSNNKERSKRRLMNTLSLIS